MLNADPSKVSTRAKKRGLPQLGTLGAGNHYAEIQVVDEIYDKVAANTMGIEHKGQVVIMIHSGSRGLGHQVATGKEHEDSIDLQGARRLRRVPFSLLQMRWCRWRLRWLGITFTPTTDRYEHLIRKLCVRVRMCVCIACDWCSAL